MKRVEKESEAITAVADAMMFAQAKQIRLENAVMTLSSNPNNFGPWLERATRGNCYTSSKDVITFLFDRFPKTFERLSLIVGYGLKSTKPRLRNGWHKHAYFLTRAAGQKTWIAGSPANYRTEDRFSPLSTMLVSNKLQEIIDQIQEIDHGAWPQAEEIEKCFEEEGVIPLSICLNPPCLLPPTIECFPIKFYPLPKPISALNWPTNTSLLNTK